MRLNSNKIVVFDLDETLGCFVELGMFWDALEHIYEKNLTQDDFFKVMNTFPEFIRPNIFKILNFLKKKKKSGECHSIMIYTNNQGHRSWSEMIASYFNNNIKLKLFDNVIAAFKVKGKKIEICRTSHNKSVDDLLRCTKMPKGTQICFLDDQYHPLMENDMVYYINIKPFTYSLSFLEMAERYYDNNNIDMNRNDFIKKIDSFMKLYTFDIVEKSEEEKTIDNIVGKQILTHLKEFFINNKQNRSRKLRVDKYGRHTRRK